MKVKPDGVAADAVWLAPGTPLAPVPPLAPVVPLAEGAACGRGCAVFSGAAVAAFVAAPGAAGAAVDFLSFEMRTSIAAASGSGAVKPQRSAPCRPTAQGSERHAVASRYDCEIAHKTIIRCRRSNAPRRTVERYWTAALNCHVFARSDCGGSVAWWRAELVGPFL
jgi:hypothetical protein